MPGFFFAVTPPEPILGAIEALRARWGHPHHEVEPHITVKIPFQWHGEVEAFLAPVRQACAATAPFEARLGEPARFPGARVLYLTVASDRLKALHLAVVGALSGIVPADARSHEGEGYTPHLTLAVGRFGIDADGMEQMEQAARVELSHLPPFTVTALRCYRREHSGERWAPFADIPLGW